METANRIAVPAVRTKPAARPRITPGRDKSREREFFMGDGRRGACGLADPTAIKAARFGGIA